MINKKYFSDNVEGAWSAAGFSFVLIVVGLPVWWLTTTVYRANLPYSDIAELASQSEYHTVYVTVVAEDAAAITEKLLRILEPQNPVHHLVKYSIVSHVPNDQERDVLNKKHDLEELLQSISTLKYNDVGSLVVYFMNSSTFVSPEIYVSNTRNIFVRSRVDLNKLVQVFDSISFNKVAKDNLFVRSNSLNQVNVKKVTVKRQVPTEPGYDITLTLMIPQPHILMVEWDANNAVKEYLGPIVKQLENIMELRIRSQVMYMTNLKISPRWNSEHQHYALPEQQLPLTINAIEAKLGSFVSTRPSLHFIIYVPTQSQTPLKIHNMQGLPVASNSFLVPRWGGVLIHNPPNGRSSNGTFVIDSQWVMSIIISQLLQLFPVPSLDHADNLQVAERLQGTTKLLTDWQLDGISRVRVLAYLNSIKITLQSLCDLVGEISNMVVSEEVAEWVWRAVSDWKKCLEATREGLLRNATNFCKDAFVNSDAAFFHPSMLALLYFPDNQKYAIYVPLFLPVSIPVLLSLRMVFRLIASYRKEKAD